MVQKLADAMLGSGDVFVTLWPRSPISHRITSIYGWITASSAAFTKRVPCRPLPGISLHKKQQTYTRTQDAKRYELDRNNAQCKRYGDELDRPHMTTNQTSLSCIRCFGKCDVPKHTIIFVSVPQKQCNNAPHLMSLCTPSLCSPSFLVVRCSVVCVAPATHLMTVTCS